jgi:FtsP/CotA-like multicopper oxidase with cupredoxin domain
MSRAPLSLLAVLAALPGVAWGHHGTAGCPSRPAAGSVVTDPEDLRSSRGELRVDLRYRRSVGADGQVHYCYLAKDGSEAPTLRVKPGDRLVLRLKNEEPEGDPVHTMPVVSRACTKAVMSAASTNVHFHGLSVPPVCHQDDVLNTYIQPGDHPFEYRMRIPENEPPGLYWYHPHIHGLSKAQVLGGASGALIVEGIERASPALAGLAERVFVIRDGELLNAQAQPVQTDSMPPPLVMRDAEGDILNTGSGGGKPAKDLSINFVPVAYPEYIPAVIKLGPGEKQLWRILNASAITYLDLQYLVDNQLQALGVVGLDGVPVAVAGEGNKPILWQAHALVPPAGRVEILVRGPREGAKASLVTRTVDTGPLGENDPTRPLATVVADPLGAGAPGPEPQSRASSISGRGDDAPRLPHLDISPAPLPQSTSPWLRSVSPVRTRHLYFSEHPHDTSDPRSPTDFFITVEGQEPKLFDPSSSVPDIVAHEGDVEDWIIENRTQELHAFHIHQIHFMLLEWNGIPLDEPYLRDTINVAYWDGKSAQYPSVKVRMDFRDPGAVGTFVYHCHLLEHEDGGMMGLIRVEPRH